MKKINILAIGLALGMLSCTTSEKQETETATEVLAPSAIYLNWGNSAHDLAENSPLKRNNPALKDRQVKVAIYSAEYITTGENGKTGNTIYFNDKGNKQLGGDFLPGYSLDGTPDVSYYVDNNRPSQDLSVDVSNAAIDRAMQTWDEVTCSDLGIFEVPFDPQVHTGFIAQYVQDMGWTSTDIGGSYEYVADVVHAGWLPAEIFDLFGEKGSTYILGVTFTLYFTDENDNLIDSDKNGKVDVAWREIYYNDAFTWNDHDAITWNDEDYDVETISLHESGHGLSQAHFGKAFRSNGNSALHFSPRAVMNAAYSGIQTDITESDLAGHCSNWSSWPMR